MEHDIFSATRSITESLFHGPDYWRSSRSARLARRSPDVAGRGSGLPLPVTWLQILFVFVTKIPQDIDKN
jgi:hypothetical protein